ncbi:MAG: hypothetical protein ACP5NW_03015 [Candidatus Woesearchaeota archaeon]
MRMVDAARCISWRIHMDDESSGIVWNKLVILIFIIGSIIVLTLLVFLMFLLPVLKE